MPMNKLFIIVLAWLLPALCLMAQTNKDKMPASRSGKLVQVSGLVLTADSGYTLPGVSVYVKQNRRGVATNRYGYFSMPVLPGDSLVFRSLSFKRAYYVIPQNADEDFSLIIKLQADTTLLQEITIFPLPPERVFKEMFMALKLPEEQLTTNMKRNLQSDLMARMLYEYEMEGYSNYRNTMSQHIMSVEQRGMVPTIPFLDPFAWRRFMRSIKDGDFKKKKWQKDEEGY